MGPSHARQRFGTKHLFNLQPHPLPISDALFLFWLIVRAPVLVQVHGTGRWELIVHGRLGH